MRVDDIKKLEIYNLEANASALCESHGYRFLGYSSRFVCRKGKKVYKYAVNNLGLRQNKKEIKIFEKIKNSKFAEKFWLRGFSAIGENIITCNYFPGKTLDQIYYSNPETYHDLWEEINLFAESLEREIGIELLDLGDENILYHPKHGWKIIDFG